MISLFVSKHRRCSILLPHFDAKENGTLCVQQDPTTFLKSGANHPKGRSKDFTMLVTLVAFQFFMLKSREVSMFEAASSIDQRSQALLDQLLENEGQLDQLAEEQENLWQNPPLVDHFPKGTMAFPHLNVCR